MTQILQPSEVEKAVTSISEGRLVGFPTETVYGLGADASNAEAVKSLFKAKNRPLEHPLIVHIAATEKMRLWVRNVPEGAQKLADAFWPGPLTLILQRNGRVAEEAVGSRPTIGLRVPNHEVALDFLEKFDGGIAAPSANKFGEVSATIAAHILDDFSEEVEYVIDGGKCDVGLESTIIEMVAEPTLLRSGGIAIDKIESVLGCTIRDGTQGESRSSGMMPSHYAPRASIEVISLEELSNLAFEISPDTGVIAPVSVECRLSWRFPDDAVGYARNLYAVFREADKRGAKKLLIVPPSKGDILAAVLDRIAKAAAPRI